MESYCITMPETPLEFFRSLAVVQAFQLEIAVGARKQIRDSYQITFRMNEKFKYFEPAIRVVKDNIPIYDYSGWNEEQRGDFDCFIKFDEDMFQRGKNIAVTIGENINYGLNHLVGCGGTPFPILKALQLKTDTDMVSDVLILNWDDVEAEKLYEYIFNNYPQLEIILDPRKYEDYPAEDVIDYFNHFKCVIGPYGLGTYIAGALKKIVLDIFTSQENAKLYGAPGTPKYLAVIGKNPSAKYVWHVFEQNIVPEVLQCRDSSSKTKHPDELTLKG